MLSWTINYMLQTCPLIFADGWVLFAWKFAVSHHCKKQTNKLGEAKCSSCEEPACQEKWTSQELGFNFLLTNEIHWTTPWVSSHIVCTSVHSSAIPTCLNRLHCRKALCSEVVRDPSICLISKGSFTHSYTNLEQKQCFFLYRAHVFGYRVVIGPFTHELPPICPFLIPPSLPLVDKLN